MSLGYKKLMRRVDFDHADAGRKLLYIRQDVGAVSRMQAATRKSAAWILSGVVGNELMDPEVKPITSGAT